MTLLNNNQAENGETKTFPILDFQQLLQKEIPERKRLLPWLCEGGIVMVYAPAGCGKSYFAQSLTVSLITKAPFMAWQVTDAVSVLYVDGEMAQNDFRDRFSKLFRESENAAKLYTLSHEDFFNVEESDLNLAETLQQERLKATIEKYPEIKVVVLDNLSCLFPTIREDKRDDWAQKVLPLLIWLRRRSIAVILLHHTAKSGDQRGTVARLDALNTSINLKPVESLDGEKAACFEVHFKKSRDCHGDDISPLLCRLVEKEGFLEWDWQRLEESAAQRLFRLIEENGGEMSVKDAAEEMEVTPSRISRIKSDLIRDGKLVKHTKLKRAKSDG